MRVHAIIAAGGTGSRFSGSVSGKDIIPKQFLKLNGKPVLSYSLIPLQKSKLVDEIIITSNNRYFDLIHQIALKDRITKLTTLVEGGKTRFISVKNAFNQIAAEMDDLIIIHDAVRPALDLDMVNAIILAAMKYGEVIYGIRISDTIKSEQKNIVIETLNREHLRAIQTPQVFRNKVLLDSYTKAGRKNDFTDESSLVEYAGHRVRIVPGYRNNIKITTPDDLKILRNIL